MRRVRPGNEINENNGEWFFCKGRESLSCCDWFSMKLHEMMFRIKTFFDSDNNFHNHKNYNFLDCDWFRKLLFPTNSLVKLLSDSLLSDTLLSDSLLSDSSISQSHSKLS